MAEIREFHAHIYFQPSTRAAAIALHRRAQQAFAERADIWHFRIFDHPVGPHPLPMFEIDFAPGALAEVIPWLMLNRAGHSILVHPDTGDDLADHRDHSLWFGDRLELLWERLS